MCHMCMQTIVWKEKKQLLNLPGSYWKYIPFIIKYLIIVFNSVVAIRIFLIFLYPQNMF